MSEIQIDILCWNPRGSGENQGIESCTNIKLDGGNLSMFEMDATGGIRDAQIDISSTTLNDVDIIVNSNGFMDNIIIYANNSNSFLLNVETNASLTKGEIYAGENITIKSMGNIDGLYLKTIFAGYLVITIDENGNMINSVIEDNDAISSIIRSNRNSIIQNVDFSVEDSDIVDINFNGKIELVNIYAQATNTLNIVCNASDTTSSCDGLIIRGPSHDNDDETPRARLECVNYGCQNLELWFMNGLNDINLVNNECPCDDLFCVNQWSLYCNYSENEMEFSTSKLTNNGCMDESGSVSCCDGIGNSTIDTLLCQDDDEQDEFWTTGAIIGFSVGGAIIIIIICVFILMFYRRKMESEAAYGRLAETGYGATSVDNE